jgi:hypothetical protein
MSTNFGFALAKRTQRSEYFGFWIDCVELENFRLALAKRTQRSEYFGLIPP